MCHPPHSWYYFLPSLSAQTWRLIISSFWFDSDFLVSIPIHRWTSLGGILDHQSLRCWEEIIVGSKKRTGWPQSTWRIAMVSREHGWKNTPKTMCSRFPANHRQDQRSLRHPKDLMVPGDRRSVSRKDSFPKKRFLCQYTKNIDIMQGIEVYYARMTRRFLSLLTTMSSWLQVWAQRKEGHKGKGRHSDKPAPGNHGRDLGEDETAAENPVGI